MVMELRELQRHWNAFGEQDPLWAILTDPSRKGGRWTPEEFFATGVDEMASVMATARAHGLPTRRRRGLDFGCGVGRLTQALANYCGEVRGLDVAPSMIAHARRFNQFGDRVRYDVQAAPPLASVDSRSIDVVYTGRVLQHIAPQFARVYIAELARVLAPGGFLSFDVPSRWLDAAVLPAGAMSSDSYRAELRVESRGRESDGTRIFDIAVTNAGPETWPAGTPLNVANRWLSADGAVVVADDQRVAIPLPLAPGLEVGVSMRIPAPVAADAAILEFDVVHEGVSWFGWQGSPTVRMPQGTSSPADSSSVAPTPERAVSTFAPVMEMHAVPRTEVEAILRQAGVHLLDVRPETHCGPRWEAWRYDVTAGGAD